MVSIEIIQEQIRNGRYLVKSHAIQHALKEGFRRNHMVEAVSDGKIIEAYPDDQRVLICGPTTLSENFIIYLHVVCEYADPEYVEFVTAYIPDEKQWENPPFKRRHRKKRR
ncbi:MAG: hypothetical protein DRI57_14980 [Deltaproteobacteria bacterium]|nr:MAG: hypothetical protein DRI57_14980 [Deltaproteobacteria bacterium]